MTIDNMPPVIKQQANPDLPPPIMQYAPDDMQMENRESIYSENVPEGILYDGNNSFQAKTIESHRRNDSN